MDNESPVARALALLEQHAAKAALEMNVLADYELQGYLKDVVESLAWRLNGPATYPNPAFSGQPEALALCFLLEASNPDAYSRLFRGILRGDMDGLLSCYEGLRTLDTFVRGLGDDHDYGYSPTSGTIQVVGDDAPGDAQYLTPQRFLALLKTFFPTDAAA